MPGTKKIAIIGVGLLGGSLALAFRGKKKFRVIGWNHRPASRRKAAKIVSVAASFEDAVRGADYVLLCAHSSSVAESLRRVKPYLSPGALVMDVSSVKGGVVREAAKIPGANGFFVPCHPMAGKEKSGPAQADGSLYKEHFVFITPIPGTPRALLKRAENFWRATGAFPRQVDAKAHDRQAAITSHLPHLLACALVRLYSIGEKKNPGLRAFIGSGFRDFTRIAGGNPEMWGDIVQLNRAEIKSVLSSYRAILSILERNLRADSPAFWRSFFDRARSVREKIK